MALALALSLLPASVLAAGESLTIGGQTYTAVPNERISTELVNGVTATQAAGSVDYLVTSKNETNGWDQVSGAGSVDTYTYVGLYVEIPEGYTNLRSTSEGNPSEMSDVTEAFLQGGKYQTWFPIADKVKGGYSLFYGGREYTVLLEWSKEDSDDVLREYVKVTRDLSSELAVAQVGNYTYETLADAVAAAKSGDTVELLKTSEGPGIKVEGTGREITIDLNNWTYTVTSPLVGSAGTETNGFQLLKGNKVTIENGGLVFSANAKMGIKNYCDLTLNNVQISAGGRVGRYS